MRGCCCLVALALLGCHGGGASNDGGALVCASGQSWRLGDQPTQVMHPGTSCNGCHQARQIFTFSIAGTVFAAPHEPDDCFGYGGATVEVTGADGTVFSLTSDVSGNFLVEAADATVALPLRARVINGGAVRQMMAAQMSGDCNSCHTQAGANGAPGRIQIP